MCVFSADSDRCWARDLNSASTVDCVVMHGGVIEDRECVWPGFWCRGEHVNGGPPPDPAVRPFGVVDVGEHVKELLEFLNGVWFVSGSKPSLECLVEPFYLAAGLGVVRSRVRCVDSNSLEVLREQL